MIKQKIRKKVLKEVIIFEKTATTYKKNIRDISVNLL